MNNDEKAQERWRIVQQVAGRLNGDRGKMPSAYRKVGRGKKATQQFDPCAKANVYLASLYPRRGGGRPDPYAYIPVDETSTPEQVRALAADTHCPCHDGWTEEDLLALEEGREPEARVTGDQPQKPKTGNPNKVDPALARKALFMADGDKKAAYSRVVQLCALRPPFDNRDLQAWYRENGL
ncbi:MAG: hypothetical protein JW892_17505 [Anaerolineae bacterium]|nr:hypothetical protein [Anaerolineae bacterium]